jgi:hypothetical protein
MRWRRRGRENEPAEVYTELRSQLLELDPAEAGLEPTPELPELWGGLMEMAFPEGVATIVALVDGTTSMYTSTGGGVIGGGAHEQVVAATRDFLAEAHRALDELDPSESADLPRPGYVTFLALCYSGRRRGEAAENELVSMEHPLSPLYAAGQDVITALREAEAAVGEATD